MKELSERLLLLVQTAEPKLRVVSDEESAKPVLPGGWSRKQVLGHLIDSASNNHQRFVRAMLADSLDFPGYDQEGSVRVQAAQEASWWVLVALWAAYNHMLAHVIARIPASKIGTVCRIGTNEPVTLGFLAEDYVRHLVHHLKQIGAA
jgi:hypothetical protein